MNRLQQYTPPSDKYEVLFKLVSMLYKNYQPSFVVLF